MSGQQHLIEMIMNLMQQGGQRGLPMRPSPELQAFLQSQGGAAQMGGNMVPGPGFREPPSPEHPVPISQDPWFEQGVPPPNSAPASGLPTGRDLYGGAVDSGSETADQKMKRLLDSMMGTSAPGRSVPPQSDPGNVVDMSGNPLDSGRVAGDLPPGYFAQNQSGDFQTPVGSELYIWITGRDGKRFRLDGPFANEVDAQRAYAQLRMNSNTDMPMEIGPMPPTE